MAQIEYEEPDQTVFDTPLPEGVKEDPRDIKMREDIKKRIAENRKKEKEIIERQKQSN